MFPNSVCYDFSVNMELKINVENPEKRALNVLDITTSRDGVKKKVPALSPFWLTSRSHLKYFPLPIKDNKLVNEMGNLEEWISDMTWFNKELEWMLQLDCHLFWCYMIHDRGCAEAVVSFLQESTPAYIKITEVTDNESIVNLYTNILANIIAVVCRLITNKENEYEWLEKDNLAHILYSKYLFSVPMLFDLITTYGRENLTILKRIFQTVMKIEPKYKDDLGAGIEYLLKAFLIIQEKIEIETKLNILTDVSLHVLDCAYIINVLLDVYPDAEPIYNTLKVHQNVAEFYENAVVSLFKKIDKINPDALGVHYVNKIRVELLGCFRKILNFNIGHILKHPNKSFEPSERYLNLMTEVASYPMFLADYNNLYPVEVDIDIIKQCCSRIDNFKIKFVMQAVLSGEPIEFDDIEQMIENGTNNSEIPPEAALPSTSNSGAESSGVRKFDTEVESILGVFPDLGQDYTRRLLQHYENAEQAIAAILEGNLPPHLDKKSPEPEVVSPSVPMIPPDPQDKMFLETGIRRFNVFDGDEFDVMTQDNPNCIIKVGKGIPGQAKTLSALLDDKSHVKALKDRYQEYSIVTENDYDDEYDDSYDAMTESETKAISKLRKAKNIILEDVETVSSSSEEDEPAGAASGTTRNRLDFCENPEAIRARYEANRQRKFGARGGINRDVLGKPKGQGQDDKTVHNRQNKEAHKSTRANHNRKGGASYKRNKGMIPS